jgi:hypothetical protein
LADPKKARPNFARIQLCPICAEKMGSILLEYVYWEHSGRCNCCERMQPGGALVYCKGEYQFICRECFAGELLSEAEIVTSRNTK